MKSRDEMRGIKRVEGGDKKTGRRDAKEVVFRRVHGDWE